MEDRSITNPEIEGSNPAAAKYQEKMAEKSFLIIYLRCGEKERRERERERERERGREREKGSEIE